MLARTERQHFVPAFYLAQWATPQERDGRLRVFDRTNGRSRPSTPDAEGFARDFYLIESREAPRRWRTCSPSSKVSARRRSGR